MFYAPRREDSGEQMARRGYSKRLPVLFLESGEVALPLPTSLPRVPTSQRAMPKAAAPTPSPRYNGITVQSAYTGHECLFDTATSMLFGSVRMLMTGNRRHPFLTVAHIVVDKLRLVVRSVQEPKEA